ncbi:hypothetical protein FNF28_01715 [Cafeteria roenbergensis]|uniref:Thioredoxin-like fold domain-containing protein n=1 Tax=Cafeteria roenbergensis TaxID=33653 RepID=A0A5A8DXC2_CAFRO|nr:hypothetical protein FNF28_01715 [Cafeteria roenbergensis]
MLGIAAVVAAALAATAVAQVPVPARPDGYRYMPLPNRSAPLQLHGYFDLTCPDCKDTWGPLKAALAEFKLGADRDPFAWMEAMFANQDKFWDEPTDNLTGTQVFELFGQVAEDAPGLRIPKDEFVAALKSRPVNLATRTTWKLGCANAVSSTPTFFANGARFAADDTWTKAQWVQFFNQVLSQ